MNLETIRDYARHLHRRGVEVVELEENGASVKIRIAVVDTNLPAIYEPELSSVKAAPTKEGLVKSQSLGWLRTTDTEHLPSAVGNGDLVAKDQVLAVIELDAVRTCVRSPFAGQVVQVCAQEGDRVDYGKVLFEVEISKEQV